MVLAHLTGSHTRTEALLLPQAKPAAVRMVLAILHEVLLVVSWLLSAPLEAGRWVMVLPACRSGTGNNHLAFGHAPTVT